MNATASVSAGIATISDDCLPSRPGDRLVFYQSQQIDETQIAACYGITNGDIIRIRPKAQEKPPVLIFVQGRQRRFEIRINPNRTIFEAIAMIEDLGISMNKKRLMFENRSLENESTLANYGIQEESELYIPQICYGGMGMLVDLSNGNSIFVGFDETQTVESLKLKIEACEGIPNAQQILDFEGIELDSSHPLHPCCGKICKLHLRLKCTKIYIITLERRLVTLRVSLDWTVDKVLSLIETCCFGRQKRLIYEGRELDNHQTLKWHNVQKGARLTEGIKLHGGMPLIIRTITGKNVHLNAEPTDTIYALKAKLWELEGVEIDLQWLCYMGNQMEDAKTLADYEVGRETVLNLVAARRY